jgi:hypothetical protein
MSRGKMVVGFAAPLLGESNQRASFTIMGQDQLQAELSLANIDWNPILARVEERTAALDRYVASIRREDHSWSTLRRRIASLAVMGLVPFLAALAAVLLLISGIVSSENGQTLAGFVIVGCVLVALLALLAVVHVALQAAFHSHLLERSAEERSMSFAHATIELWHSNALVGRQVIQHFRSYGGLRDYFQNIRID